MIHSCSEQLMRSQLLSYDIHGFRKNLTQFTMVDVVPNVPDLVRGLHVMILGNFFMPCVDSDHVADRSGFPSLIA